MRLEDLIFSYPLVSDPQLQRKIATYPEFAENTGKVSEDAPQRGEYFRHQRTILRYMRVYDRLFLYHEMGTGKTCAMKSVSSFYKYKYFPRRRYVNPMFGGVNEQDADAAGVGDAAAHNKIGLPNPPTAAGGFASILSRGQKDTTGEMFEKPIFYGSNNAGGRGVGVSAFVDALVELADQWEGDIRHCFVLVKGPYLVHEFERQIACECADPGEFVSLNTSSMGTRAAATNRKKLRAELKQWFTIETTNVFVRKYLCQQINGEYKLLPDSELRAKFSRCLFIVDEVHSLYNEARDGRFVEDKSIKEKIELTKKTLDFKFTYDSLHRLFHIAEGTKIILSSGTPMINGSNEIKSEMNLILPLDMQMPKNLDVNNAEIELLEKYFNGRISYVRELDTGANVVYEGEHFKLNINNQLIQSEDIVYMQEMSEHQSIVYEKILSKGNVIAALEENESDSTQLWSMLDLMDSLSDEAFDLEAEMAALEAAGAKANAGVSGAGFLLRSQNTHFQSDEINASRFVFPDGSIKGSVAIGNGNNMATAGLGRYVFSPERGVYYPTREFLSYINTPEKIRNLSSSFSVIVKQCINHDGKVFVFTGQHVQGAGAILIGVCLGANGFEAFRGTESAFIGNETKDEEIDEDEDDILDKRIDKREGAGCGNTQINKQRSIKINKRPRYAIITNFTTDNEKDFIFELFNSPENLHGEYLKVISGSVIMRDGLNMNNTTQVHTFADWHASGTSQAIARVLRATSYNLLVAEERAKAIKNGIDPATVQIKVQVFKHAALPRNEEIQSIDLELYAISEKKDRNIRRIKRIIKRSAVDCVLNYIRNIRDAKPIDKQALKLAIDTNAIQENPNRKAPVDGSIECDYDTCSYDCAAQPLPEEMWYKKDSTSTMNEISHSTKNLEFAAEILMSSLVKEGGILRTHDLASRLLIDPSILSAAAEMLSREGRIALDRFGFPCTFAATPGGSLISLRRSFVPPAGDGPERYTSGLIASVTSLNTAQEVELTVNAARKASARAAVQDAYYATGFFVSAPPQTINARNTAEAIAGATAVLQGEQPNIDNEPVTEIALEESLKIIEKNAKYMDTLPVGKQITLFEYAITQTYLGRRDLGLKLVLARFSQYLYTFPYPENDFEKAEKEYQLRGHGRGRRAKAGAPFVPSFELKTLPWMYSGRKAVLQLQTCPCSKDIVFIHIMNIRSENKTSYAVAAQIHGATNVVIRVLSLMEGGEPRWRNSTLLESSLYRIFIDRMREINMAAYGDLYGSIFNDGKFRIHDIEMAGIDGKTKNKREEARGRVCQTWPLGLLIGVAYRAGTPLPDEMVNYDLSHIENIPAKLAHVSKRTIQEIDKLSFEQIEYEMLWWEYFDKKGMTLRDGVVSLCDLIELTFDNKNLLQVET